MKIIDNLEIWFNKKHSEINTRSKYQSIKDLEGFKTVLDISQNGLKKKVNPPFLTLEIIYILRNQQWNIKREEWMISCKAFTIWILPSSKISNLHSSKLKIGRIFFISIFHFEYLQSELGSTQPIFLIEYSLFLTSICGHFHFFYMIQTSYPMKFILVDI